ncbi:Hypothetical protein PAS_chr3_1000 [Komagataella phaffii GS115]|uniref:Uncharacterized protein n=1 Tax=Komagataella phaffii (strain GS115 / ATCC 20864) TaxID=644223 RepID=C4R676_KOMPG|nr:Hypothetical protein PAS_chr3_1000 [Komagataella phaffii GS115]CAY71062.1 Hypothetical protein PAS_chr3_1000 [Komagataella phaffii GS115]
MQFATSSSRSNNSLYRSRTVSDNASSGFITMELFFCSHSESDSPCDKPSRGFSLDSLFQVAIARQSKPAKERSSFTFHLGSLISSPMSNCGSSVPSLWSFLFLSFLLSFFFFSFFAFRFSFRLSPLHSLTGSSVLTTSLIKLNENSLRLSTNLTKSFNVLSGYKTPSPFFFQ